MGNIIHGIQGFLRDRDIDHHGLEWIEAVADVTVERKREENVDGENNTNDGSDIYIHWKPLPAWIDHFELHDIVEETDEKKNENSNDKGSLRTAVRAGARNALQKIMTRRMTKRVFHLVLDITSDILTIAGKVTSSDMGASFNHDHHALCNDGLVSSGSDGDGLITEEVHCLVGRLLNDINGILLTYRFGHEDKEYRMKYIRRKATDQLTATLWQCLPSEATADRLLEIQQRLRRRLLLIEAKTCQGVVIPHLDQMLENIVHIDERINERIEQRFGDERISLTFEQRLAQIDQATDRARVQLNNVSSTVASAEAVIDNVIVTGSKVATNSTGVDVSMDYSIGIDSFLDEKKRLLMINKTSNIEAIADVAQRTLHEDAIIAEETLIHSKESVLAKKSEVVFHAVEAVKKYVLSEMDSWTDHIVSWLDTVLLEFYEVHLVTQKALDVAEQKGRTNLEDLQREMYRRVEALASLIERRVKSKVDEITQIIGVFMIHHDDDEDDNRISLPP